MSITDKLGLAFGTSSSESEISLRKLSEISGAGIIVETSIFIENSENKFLLFEDEMKNAYEDKYVLENSAKRIVLKRVCENFDFYSENAEKMKSTGVFKLNIDAEDISKLERFITEQFLNRGTKIVFDDAFISGIRGHVIRDKKADENYFEIFQTISHKYDRFILFCVSVVSQYRFLKKENMLTEQYSLWETPYFTTVSFLVK